MVGALVAIGAAYYMSQPDSQPADPADENDYTDSQDDALTTVADWMTANIIESETMNSLRTQMPEPGKNIAAMLYAISRAEGTAGQPDPYRVVFGYTNTIKDFAEHPAITGEWRGGKLSDAMCAGAGLGPGCVSTAAGKYQIIKRTWISVRDKLGLRDFSPESQDRAAIELLRQRGALGPLGRGDFAGAVAAARKEWASPPGAGYGQGERTIAWLTDRFTEAGGVLA
jgi:lysozyme